MEAGFIRGCRNTLAAARLSLLVLFAMSLGVAGTAAFAAESLIDSIVVKLRDGAVENPTGGLTNDEQEALFDEVQTPFSHVGYTRDGALELRLLNPLPLHVARAAVNRVRMMRQVLYANVVPPAAAGATDAANVPGAPSAQPNVRTMIVKFRDTATSEAARRGDVLPRSQIDRLSARAGQPLGHERAMSGDAFVVRLFQALPLAQARSLAAILAADPAVEYAEPDILMHPLLVPNDPRYAEQWHYMSPLSVMGGANLPPAWDLTTGSLGIVVAVLDTGYLPSHPDLAGRFIDGYDFISDCARANDNQPGPCTWTGSDPFQVPNTTSRDSDASDPGDWVTSDEAAAGSATQPPYHWFHNCPTGNSSFHGSHVAGTIGAATDNSTGVAGINWVSKILPVRVLGKCGGTTADIIDAIRWSVGMSIDNVPDNPDPARVLNMSFGGSSPSCGAIQGAINDALARNAVVVVAAGNSNADASQSTPANCNGVITVGATGFAGQRAPYSNYGPMVEISAPGGAGNDGSQNGHYVLSTINNSTTSPDLGIYTYASYQGTSMATPHVSGIASLMLSRNPALTPSQVVATIQTTARAFPTGTLGDCTTALCGAGIIDAGAAVLAATLPTTSTTLTSSGSPATVGAVVTFTATVSGANPTGSVTFTEGGNAIGCPAGTLSGTPRIATCSTSGLAVGTHSIVASYAGDAGNAPSSSTPLSQVIIASAATVWVDDAVPAGATLASDGGDSWNWVSNPLPFSGALAHQSALGAGSHQHYFYNATATLAVGVGETLFAYVYLDSANPPSEVMLQWNDGSWEHRAYWGTNQITYGVDGTPGRRFMGALPITGQWVRLDVPAAQVGLEGRTLNGMAFTLYGGRATWDYAGKGTVPPPVTYQLTGTVAVGATALPGVAFTATNGGNCTASDGVGHYACTVPQGWTGTVTPARSGYTFAPSSRSYSSGVTADQSGQDYAASVVVITTYQLTGTVAVGATALPGVAFTATNGGNCTASDGAGHYACTVVQGWTGTVTPALSGYTFTPSSRSYSSGVVADQTGQDYAAAVSTATVWVDDAVPAGATLASDGGDSWNWVSNPLPFSGALAHQSALGAGSHQHYFYNATATLAVGVGETLFAYVYLDSANPPSEVMLQWNDGSWEHRAYWGTNQITYGVDGTPGRRFMGALPITGQWVRLDVPAAQVGLEGRTLNGMAFTLYGGRATWDYAGKGTVPPPVTYQLTGTVAVGATALPGVAFTATNGGNCTASDGVGHYACTVPQGWTGTVTPARSGYTFAPSSRSYSSGVTADQSGQDYAASVVVITTYQLTGTVAVGATALPGVAFTATNGGNCTASDGAGHYACTVVQGWTGTVTPALSGYTFTPSSRSYSSGVVADQTGQDYAAAVSTATVWVDDAVPAGATLASDGGDSWNWVSNPLPFSGALAHQSALGAGSHQHYFYNATATLAVGVGETLFAYVYLDSANPPSEVMLQWNDGSWEHRAYWGTNQITYGVDGTPGRRFMGALPITGQWVRLDVPAAQVGLEGRTLNGMAFTLYGGRATWDYAGKGTVPPPVTYQLTGTVAVGATALPGVAFTATNGGNCTASDGVGHYACTVPQGWTGTVTPARSGYTFAPSSRSYSSGVTADQSGQDYAASVVVITTYQLTGTVAVGATALPGVAFTATNGGNCTASDGAGHYACTVVQGWTGTVTPALSGYTFTPSSRSYSSGVVADQTGQDYAAAVSTATVWVDDAVPAGATLASDGGDSWNWVSNPLPFSGALAHQSALGAGSHQHYFYNATATLAVGVGETLFAYVYLDSANPPSEVMLQWNDGSWEHRAYWGTNQITYGVDGTPGRRFMGALPITGQWVRLDVPAAQVGLEGRTLNGMAFTLYGGRATWDYAGK